MTFWDRLRSAFALPDPALVRAAQDYAAQVQPPLRPAAERFGVTTQDAVTLPAVYRALQVITTAAAQMPLDVERHGLVVPNPPALIRRPNMDMSRSDFVEALVMSMVCDGNAFILKDDAGTGSTVQLVPLNPFAVTVYTDPKTNTTRYGWNGKTYTGDQIEHLHLFRLPGQLRGYGPIQAAQSTMRGAANMRDHMGQWFTNTGQPTGVLSSEQELTSAQAMQFRNGWNGLDPEGNPIPQTANPSGIKVLGKGLHYEPIILNPKDAMWLESQAFTTLEVARMFGIPTSLMYAAPEGNSLTYSNVEQEWLAFVRFSLMQYLRKIEEALTNLTPNGQTVRFRLEALLRSDTKTRFEGYQIAIASGFMTRDEARAIEGLPALTPDQLAQIPQNPQPQKATP